MNEPEVYVSNLINHDHHIGHLREVAAKVADETGPSDWIILYKHSTNSPYSYATAIPEIGP